MTDTTTHVTDTDFGSVEDSKSGQTVLTIQGKVVTEEKMLEVQALLCDHFLKVLQSGQQFDPKAGVMIPLQPNMLSAVAAFLSQNGIKGVPRKGHDLNDVLGRFFKHNKTIVDAALAEVAEHTSLQ